MILYDNSCGKFKNDVDDMRIEELIAERFQKVFKRKAGYSEKESWKNSLGFMERVVRKSQVPDDCWVLIEYGLPNTSKRVDFILMGQDGTEKNNLVIIELKQWEKAQATDSDGIVTTYVGRSERPVLHPSYQALSYRRFMENFQESVYTGKIQPSSCAFLHNYVEKKVHEPLRAPIYKQYVDESPLFFRDDHKKLQEFLYNHVGYGKGKETLYYIQNGKIRPSRKLIESVGSLFTGNEYFTLLDDQKILFEKVISIATGEQIPGQKNVIIIQGGPGTGKSVISFNLLYALLKKGKNVVLSAPNAAFRDVMKKKLLQTGLKKSRGVFALDNIITGSAGFVGLPANTYDVVIVDEAHRLKNGSAYQYQGQNQVDDIMGAARTTVFFVDDNQMVRPEDIGNSHMIEIVAAKYHATLYKEELTVQFRCSGMDGYINWLDHMLQIRDTGNFDGWDDNGFTFKVCDTPQEMQGLIEEKSKAGFDARILAGYAWKWSAAKDGNPSGEIEDVVIDEYGFSMPWNSRSARTTWAIDESGLSQVGCIHTSQGLEFDYVGIIIGKDLQFDPVSMRLFAGWDNYKDAAGKKGLKDKPEALAVLVKNIYKTLMTRGMKGCYVFCCDPHVKRYIRSFFEEPRQTVLFGMDHHKADRCAAEKTK